jgi:hypothetical protein
MATQSQVTASQLTGTIDNSIKVIKTIKQPFIKQFVVMSRKSTTTIKPNLYNVKVETDTPELRPSSKVKCYCDCLDFSYRQAYCFNEKGALLIPQGFVIEPPDKTNPGCQKFRPCKHIKEAIRYGLERKI